MPHEPNVRTAYKEGTRVLFSEAELEIHDLLLHESRDLIARLDLAYLAEAARRRHVITGALQEAKEHLNYVAHLLDLSVVK